MTITANTAPKTAERQHDEKLVELWIERDRAVQGIKAIATRAYSFLGFRTGYQGKRFTYFTDTREAITDDAIMGLRAFDESGEKSLREVEEATKLYDDLMRAFDERDDVQERIFEHEQDYTGWTRYVIVTSSAGHVHRSTSCPTCFASTTYGFVVELSGQSEEQAIALVGETLCSVCFPDAPVAERKLTAAAAAKLAWTPDRDEREAKAAAKAAEKAERDALKAARGLKLAESLAHKIDEMVNLFGVGRDRGYDDPQVKACDEWTWTRKGYESAFFVWKGTR